MRLALVPRQTEFYDLFRRAGENALEVARLTEQRFREFPETSIDQAQIKQLETHGDQITTDLFQLLNTQYITPFDREDIYSLTRALDDVVDFIDEASDLLGLYKVEATMEQAVAQCGVLVRAVEALAAALREMRGLKGVERYLVEIHRLEDEADRLVRDAIAALFEDEEVSPREIIRWKDIFEALERAVDSCETAAHLIGNVVVKNA